MASKGRAAQFHRSRRHRVGIAGLLALAVVAVALVSWSQPATAKTFEVNSTIDRADANPGNGVCATSAGACTLRAAIQEANALPGADTIQLPAGVYELEIPSVNDDLPETGDFDIFSPITIVGAGPGVTIIDGGWPLPGADPVVRGLDRLFEIHPTAGNVTISGVTLREGFSDDAGGAIQNWSSGTLRLENVHVLDNLAAKDGGGINNADPIQYDWATDPLNPPKSGRIEIVGSTLSGNAAGGVGAAVNNVSTGTITILNSTVSNNPGLMIPDPQDPEGMIPAPGVYEPGASAITNKAEFDTAGTIRITDSTVSGNYATQNGAGVLNAGSGTLIVERSTITNNTSEADGGGIYSVGGTLTVTASTISGNHAHDGGGIYGAGAVDTIGLRPRFTIAGSTVTGNTALASGGGISVGGEAVATITDVTVSENTAGDDGSGLNASGRASLTVTRGRFQNNAAHNEGGGAWIASERLATIQDSVFSGNAAGVPTAEDLANPAGANVAGGGGLYTEGGPVTITGSTFAGNTATEEGGGLSIDNLGDVTISDSVIRDNRAGHDGGGIENSGTRVTFERLTITGNRATLDGGGIYNSSSGLFTILDTTVELNSAMSGGGLANAPDNSLIIRGSSFLRNTARHPSISEDGDTEDAGLGGGIFSLADGDAQIENTTISGNVAAVSGGGLFHDADGEVKLVNVTIWRNSAPSGGGIGIVESDFVPEVPPKANVSVILRNTIVGGSRQGGSCDWYVTSEGGNLDGGGLQSATPWAEGAPIPEQSACFLSVAPNSDSTLPAARDRRSSTFAPDAIADNGGLTLTHALTYGSLAIDAGVTPCPETDQRGVTRPQNGRCDIGAYEFVGPLPPPDSQPPDTEYVSGPIQDSWETVAFEFTGSDTVVLPIAVNVNELNLPDPVLLNDGTPVAADTDLAAGTVIRVNQDVMLPDGTTLHATSPEELQFECRLIETDLAEEPEIYAPWDPIPPEFWWVSCTSPWKAPLLEEGLFTFEVRAIDRADNTDPTPATHVFSGMDTEPPDTIIVEKPPLVTNSRSATFTFTAIDNLTPPQFMEYECRLDSRDPDLWLECVNPLMLSNLTSGYHTIEVRAADAADNVDRTPARYTWHVGPLPGSPDGTPFNCDEANVTLTAVADAWVDQVNPTENFLFYTELEVRSAATGDPTAQPPEPIIPENARVLIRFDVPSDAPHCTLESANLRLYREGGTPGRTIQIVPLAGSWLESTVTWFNQPAAVPGITPVTATTGNADGYMDWDVTDYVNAILAGELPNHGWLVLDAHENDPDGGDQSFISREMPQDPPDMSLPLLVLRFEADGAAPPPPPVAETEPSEVYCGQVILKSTLVANDLTGCLGEGLVIGAPNIVLDLNGHTITSGVPIELGEEDGLLAGIRNSGHTNVVIRNGTVKGFGYGVLLGPGTTHNVVEAMTLTGNALAGAHLFDADDGRNGNTIRNNEFIGNGETGLSLVSDSENSVVEDNYFLSNGVGIYLHSASGHLIQNNEISGVLINPLLDSDAGIRIEVGSRNNILRNNTISDTGDAGVVIEQGSQGNVVEGGVMYRNGDAGVIIQDSDRTQVIGIVAHQQSDGGVVLSNANNSVVRDSDLRFNPSGVEASNSNNLVIQNNDASDSLQTGFEIGNGLNIRVQNNVANGTGGAGISLEGAAFDALGNPVGGALIEGNTANENKDDGIAVADGGHTIANNNAHNNAGYGIRAGEEPSPGEPPSGTNIDGEGNRASGNAEPLQCVGVVCITDGSVPLTAPDLTAPETELTGSPPNPSNSTSATFTFTGIDTVVLPVDVDVEDLPSPVLLGDGTPVGAGTTLLAGTIIRATDNVILPDGTLLRASPLTAMVFECRLDPGPDPLPPPAEPPDLEPPDPYEEPEPPDSVPDGPGWHECVSPVTYHGLEQDEHHFEVRAHDWAGNRDLTPATYDWVIDITAEDEADGPDSVAPNTFIFSGPDSPTTSSSATFRFSGSDNLTPGLSLTFQCRLDSTADSAWESCAYPEKAYTGLTPGQHTFEVRARDRAGNVDATPATHTWTTVEPPAPTPPDTSIEQKPDPVTVRTDATFTFSSNDPEATFECSLNSVNGGAFESCISPKEYTGIAVGERVFQVRAVRNDVILTDGSILVDPDPATYAWKVGTAPVPGTVFCGQVITQSIKVRNDLIDCLWDGLVVGAHGITIDLDGHVIDGKGVGAGIRNDGFDSVTIRNGTVRDFDYGVALNVGTVGNIVELMTLESNQEAAIALGHLPQPDPATGQPAPEPAPATFQSGVSANTIRFNSIRANDVGIWLTNATRESLIRDNVLGMNAKQGIWIDRSHANKIESNEIQGSANAGVTLQGSNGNILISNELTENGDGILIDITRSGTVGIKSNDNRIEKNTITESNGNGIEVVESDGNQLLYNVVRFSNGDGISLYLARNSFILGNDVRANTRGIALKSSSGNRLEANNASDSEGTGISLQALSLSNVLLKNVSSNNDGDGIYVGDETAGNQGMTIEGNTANNNKGFGIYVPKVSHTIKANTTNDNGGWGIWASAGSNGRFNIDGGGNKAQGNTGPLDPITLKPLQCFTITCDGGDAVKTDFIAPDTFIMETPPDPNNHYVATFRFSGSDNLSTVTFQCSINDDTWTSCVSPAEYDLPLGHYTFAVRAVDLAGNIDLSPAIYTWWHEPPDDDAPAAISITSGPDLTTVRTEATFEFSANKRGLTFECALDQGTFAPCSSPKTYSGLAVGQHTFRVRAIGTTEEATYAWRITSAAVPAQVACGQIIVQSTRVLNDLLDCPGHALIIGAHNITIDLDGHFIDGVGLGAGILNNGFDSVTITNGTISEFDYGIQLNPGTSLNIISSMRLEANQEAGILLSDADQNGKGNTIRNNTIVLNTVGVALVSNTQHTVVRNNAMGGNAKGGVHVEHSNNIQIENNEITNSGGDAITLLGASNSTVVGNLLDTSNGSGVAVGDDLLASNFNLIERNTIVDSNAGILVAGSTGNRVLYNVVSGSNGAGVVLDLSRDTLVRGNDLRDNKGGVELSESSFNRIESNNASGTLGTGIEVGAISYNNVILQNAASGNSGEGIEVTDAAPAGRGNLIDGNTADGNGGDGIGVFGAGHSVKNNSAQVNGGWGIYAAVSGNDGGGNFAAGNMEPAQCYNIVCEIGEVPGAPDTWIVSGPVDVDPDAEGIQSNSRNASFTYMGGDGITPLYEMVWECRLDSTDAFAWEDCEYPQEYLGLSPGEHTFEVRAVNNSLLADPTPAKFTWTYVPLPPGVAPIVTIDMAPEPETWALDAIFTFYANEPDVTFQCRVDSFPYQPCGFESVTYMSRGAFEWSLDEIEVGLHTFYVRAIDFEGNVGQPTTYTWRLNGIVTIFLDGPGFTPGETPLDPPTGGPVRETTATIVFTSNMDGATFECSLDLGPFVPCGTPVGPGSPYGASAVSVTYTGLWQGDHLLRVIATDPETGIEELEAAEFEWEVVEFEDTTPPETTIERAPANNSSSTIFEFQGTDDFTPPWLLTFECRIDSTNNLDWFECTSPFNLLDLYTYQDLQMALGQHTFEVRARDNAEPADPNAPSEGNVDPTPATYTWTMVADTVAPGTGIISGPGAKVGPGEIVFEFFGTDNATPVLRLTFECSIDNGPWESCESPESVQGLEIGVHTFRVRAVDLAGNVDQTPATRTWEIVPAPVTTFTSGPSGRIVDGQLIGPPSIIESAIFVFSADQEGSTFECSLNGEPFAQCVSPYAVWIVEDGTHELEVRATNPEGVVEEPPAVYEWMVALGPDTTPPDTRILSGPPNPDRNTVATFTFTGTDNRTLATNLSFECALDGFAFNSCTSPQQFSDLTRGEHVMRIRAKDAAGNFDPTPATYTWTVDSPPVVTILTGPEDETESTTATFTWVSNVPGSTFLCWLDGAMEPCESGVTYTDLAHGEHLFAVLGISPAGIKSFQWEDWEWTIGDLTPPITIITSGPDLESESLSATFAFESEPDVTFLCSIDGRTPLPCESPVEYPRLHPGQHRFEVVAMSPPQFDRFGQPLELLYDPVPAIYEWTIVDLEPPDTEILYGPAATTGSRNAYFGVSSDDPTAVVECSLDGAAFSDCDAPIVFEDLLVGQHTLRARAVDLAGNVDPTPAVYQWTIVQLATNTPVGTNVTVELPLADDSGTATVTFFQVTLAGATSIDALTGGPSLPGGYFLAGGRFYDISTTAEYGEPVTVCVPYDPALFDGFAARLLHFDGSVWVDVTTMTDPFNGRVCGQPEEFSLFAVAAGSGVAPIASIISGPPNPSNSGTATFSFWADHPEAMVMCSLDGMPFTGCTSPVTYTHLEEGDHTFEVMAVGSDGQMQTIPTLYEWDIILPPDTTPPDTTITVWPPTLTANFIVWFEFTGTDDQTHPLDLDFECSLDGGPWEDCDSPEEIEVLTAGEHQLDVRAVDLAGNVDPTPATRIWIVVDFSEPDTEILTGPEEETESTSATFTFTGETPNGVVVTTFDCSLDGEDFAPCTSPQTYTNLAPGAHVFMVRARDQAGNIDPWPEFYEWLITGPVDTTAPDTFIVAAPTNPSGPDVIFGFQSNEEVLEFQCSLDGAPFSGCDAVLELEGLASGQHTLRVRALDLAANVDPTPALHDWTVVGEPDTIITSGPPARAGGFSATFEFTSDQQDVTFECAVDGTAWVPCTSPYIFGPLVLEGQHEFEVRAVNQFRYLDGTRVVDQSPATWEWEVADADPPDTFIRSVVVRGPLDLIEPNTIEFRLEGEDDYTDAFELEFECSLDGGPWESCDAPLHYISLEELADGLHTLRVRAVDEWGNVDPTPAERTFTVEGEPETTILSGPDQVIPSDSTSATFTFSSNMADATFECLLDGAEAYTACTSQVTFNDLPYGEHELLVRAVRPGGTVDLSPAEWSWTTGHLTAPVVTIHTGPAVATTETTATFTFSADDPDALFLCSLDGSQPMFCASGVTYENLAAGPHTFEVEATKPNLLVDGLAAEWIWTVEDHTPPETTIVSGPPAEIGLGTAAIFTFSSNELDASFECSLNGAPFAECASPPANSVEFTGLEAGEYTLLVRAVDPSLNVDASPEPYTWTVVSPPITTITSAPPETTSETTATFSFVSDQDGSTFECALDGADFTPCESPITYTGLTDSGHLFEVQATNMFGVVEESPVSYAWTIELPADVEAPETTIDAAPSSPSSSTSATFEFSSDQPDSTFECALDEAPFAPCSSPQEYTDLAEGTHLFTVRAINVDGVADLSPATHEWTIDLPPDTMIESGPPASTVSTTAEFVFSSDDPFATFECSLDGGASWGSCPVNYTIEVEVGTHTLLVRAKDAAGNIDESPASYTWTVTPLPDTFITSGPEEATESTTATFEFESDQPDATFECLLDDAPFWVACESGITYTGLALDEHEFFVRAVDANGHADPTPADWEWEIGVIPPAVTITSGPQSPTEDRTATFVFSAAGWGSSYECALDGQAFAPCVSPKSYSGVPLGAHTFQVRAFHANAIVDAPIATYEWTVADLTAPETTILSAPADPSSSAALSTFTFSSNDPTATFECSLNGEPFAGCSSSVEYTLLPGDYTFQVRAIDPSGNVDGTPATHTWTVVGPPDTTIVTMPESEIAVRTATFEFTSDQEGSTFECSLDRGPFVPCESPHQINDLSDGDHEFEVRAINSFGIADPEPALYEWTVEAGPPVTTITSAPASPTESTVATFRFSANEAEVTFECRIDSAEETAFVECFSPHPISGLAVGEHTFEVRASDGAGNVGSPASHTWTVLAPPDTTAPETTIGSTPPSETGHTTATFTFSSNEPNSTFECALDEAAFEPCESPATYAELAVGAHTFQVRATDAAGNTDPTPASYSWAIVAPPDTTILSGPSATDPSSTAIFTFEADQLAARFECSLDGADFAACTSPATYAGLANGEHTFAVRAIGALSGVDATPASYTWTVAVDNTPPVTTIVSGPTGTTTSTSATFTFSANEAGSTFECALDGAAFTACTSPYTIDGLAEGEHTLVIRATDPEGNTEDPGAIHSWTIDLPPVATIDSGPDTTTESTSASFTFSANEPATFACSLDDGPFTPCTSPKEYSGLALGQHTFDVRATDTFGNVSEPESYSWTIVDLTPPETTIDSGPEAMTISTSATFAFSSNEQGSTFECALDGDGTSFSSCTSPHTINDLAVGEHTLRVRAKDPSGNVDPTPASYTWTVDVLSETTIDSGPSGTIESTSATFTFSSSKPDSTFECSLDGADFAACESPVTYTGLADGEHTFAVRAVDASGTDLTPATWTWTVDTPPDTTIDSGPAASTSTTSATFTFSSSKEGSTFECALDGPSFSSCASPATFTSLAVGEHELQVRAKDANGKLDPTPDSYTWTVVAAPDTTIVSGPEELTESRDATFEFTSDDPAATFECSLDDALFTACTSPVTYTGLALGEHEFIVRAKDSEGTVDPTPAEYSWDIGYLTAPVVTITTHPEATTSSTEATFEFSTEDPDAVLQCSLDGAPFTLCASPKSYTGLALGDHTFEVQGIKQHLLVDPEPALYEWEIVDETAPETTITSGPDATTTSTEVTFEFTGSDNATLASDLEFECAIDGAAFASCASPVELAGLADGTHTFAVRAIDAAGNVGPPASSSWTVLPPPNTPAGTNVTVAPDGASVTVTFANVTAPGDTTVTSTTDAPELPNGYLQLGTSYYDVNTTASFEGSVTICLTYDSVTVPDPVLLHYDGSAWIDVTTSVDSSTGVICGVVDSLSPFAVAAPADTTAPETTITSGPASETIETSATFAFTSEDGATFECALDGSPFEPCASPATYSDLALGPHYFQVQAVDQAGNADPTPDAWIWTIVAPDTTAPVTTIDSGPEAETERTDATFAFSADETGATFECALNGAAFAACTSPVTHTGLAVGPHSFEVRATDRAGNVEADPAAYTWTVVAPPAPEPEPADTTPPETTLTWGPPATTSETSASFAFAADEPATFECALDGNAFAACTSPVTYTGLAVGTHGFRVQARDAAGNVDETPAGHSWSITLPPDCGTAITVTANADAWIDQNSPTSNKGTDSILKVTAKNPRNNQRTLVRFQLPTLPEGCEIESATLRLYAASSKSGRVLAAVQISGAWTETGVTWNNQPATTGSPATTASGSGWREWNVATAVEAIYDGAPNHGFLIRDSSESGSHEQQFHAREKGQNPPQLVIRFAPPDTTPPETTLGSHPEATTASPEATFTFTASEADATFECSLDSAPFAPCTSPHQLSGLGGGGHTFAVRAKDAAGNVDGTPATFSWTIDTVAPETAIASSPPSLTNGTSATFTYSSSEGGSTFACALDGAASAPCPAGGTTYHDLGDGVHTFGVVATDGVGNTDPTPATFTWTIDTVAPATTITAGPPATTGDQNAIFTFTANEAGWFECSLNDSTFAACASPATYSGLALGQHTFAVRAVDAAGNVGAPTSYTWTVVDLTPPETTLVAGPPATTEGTSATFEFVATEAGWFECALDGAAFAPCTSPVTYTGLALGPHTFAVRAIDAAGNVDSTPASWTWTVVDQTPPETVIEPTVAPAATTTETSATFAFSSEAGATFECALDGAAFAPCTSPVTYTGLPAGPHTFAVRAKDAAGNVDPTPASHTWTIEEEAPPNGGG